MTIYSEEISFSKTTAMKCQDDVNQLLKNGFHDQLPIKYYVYAKLYNDGSRIYLSNVQPWLTHVLTHFPHGGLTGTHFSNYDNAYIICQYDSSFQFYHLMHQYGIAYPLLITERTATETNIHFFATSTECPCPLSYYYEAKEIFRRYTLFFKEKAATLIADAKEDRKILPKTSDFCSPVLTAELERYNHKNSLYRDLLLNLDLKTIPIHSYNQTTYLTNREYQCLVELAKGYKNKEIAKQLHISFRTVDHHIANIKRKLNLSTRNEIFQCLLQNNLIEIKALL